MSIRFDGQVAIVTGAGGGIGKQHALELSRRGKLKSYAPKHTRANK